jgi:hypothetical protein
MSPTLPISVEDQMMGWFEGEPTLEEVFSDPTVHVLMERDVVNPDDLRLLLEHVKSAIEGRRASATRD